MKKKTTSESVVKDIKRSTARKYSDLLLNIRKFYQFSTKKYEARFFFHVSNIWKYANSNIIEKF